MSAKRLFTSAGVALLVLATLPASADTEPASASADPQGNGVLVATDPAGDANFINGWGYLEQFHEGPDTRPASIDGADLEQIRFSTSYATEKILRPDGTVERVTYVPDAIRISMRTHGDVAPLPGPHSLLFRVPVRSLGPRAFDPPYSGDMWCWFTFEAWIQGPDAPAEHPESRAQIRHQRLGVVRNPCWPSEGGPPTLSESYGLSVEGNIVTMEYPLDLLKQAVGDGTRLTWASNTGGPCLPPTCFRYNGQPSVRAVNLPVPPFWSVSDPWDPNTRDYGHYPNTVDETDRITDFDVGSDVPPPVVCSQQPAHPDCQM